MSLKYIRESYGVPAKRGTKVNANGEFGVITGARGAYLTVRIEGSSRSRFYHPTWEMQYLRELNSTETK